MKVSDYLEEHIKIAQSIDPEVIEQQVILLKNLKSKNGRLFILGVGGSAGNASHACNDFRKLCGIEAYAPTDNVSELTARTNDEGWETVFASWLKISRLSENDILLVFSVGGGNKEKNVSVNLINAIDLALETGSKIIGVVGRDDGYLAKNGDAVVIIPVVNPNRTTPHSEGYQAIVWHCLVSHPSIQINETKW
jgi:D-sedoheptulose 7-phosphate isomerase